MRRHTAITSSVAACLFWMFLHWDIRVRVADIIYHPVSAALEFKYDGCGSFCGDTFLYEVAVISSCHGS